MCKIITTISQQRSLSFISMFSHDLLQHGIEHCLIVCDFLLTTRVALAAPIFAFKSSTHHPKPHQCKGGGLLTRLAPGVS